MMDRTDFEILQLLLENPRVPVTEVAEKVDLTWTPCKSRMDRLFDEDYLVFTLNEEKSKYSNFKYTLIKLKSNRKENVAKFVEYILNNKRILSCDHVEGVDFDFLLKIGFASKENYEKIISDISDHELFERSGTISVIRNVKRRAPSIDDFEIESEHGRSRS